MYYIPVRSFYVEKQFKINCYHNLATKYSIAISIQVFKNCHISNKNIYPLFPASIQAGFLLLYECFGR